MAWMNSHLRHDEDARSIRVIAYLMAREYYEQPGLVGWISRAMLVTLPCDPRQLDSPATILDSVTATLAPRAAAMRATRPPDDLAEVLTVGQALASHAENPASLS